MMTALRRSLGAHTTTTRTQLQSNARLLSFSATARTHSHSHPSLYQYQESLPALPVPPLAQTLQLYKESIKPFYPNGENDDSFKKYAAIIDEFQSSSEGQKLQQKLEAFAVDKRNWLSEFWDNYAYLDYRDPVSPFVSYFFSHKDLNTTVGKDQSLKAAALTFNILKFMESIEDQSLAPELIKGNPFCMESFKWMFNNSRIPGDGRDTNVQYDPKENRFMIIISNGHIYKVQTHNSQGVINDLEEMYSAISEIKTHSANRGTNSNPIGILTSSNRDDWYKNHEMLRHISPKNQAHLDDIAKSSFVLCLDDNIPITIEAKSRNAWHGNGINRWFDKPIQIFVAKNASSGFLGEHSKMDGTPTLRLNDWLVNQIESLDVSPEELSSFSSAVPAYETLDFDVNPAISNAIVNETTKFNTTVNSLDIKTWQYFGLGKDDIKLFKASPDSFVQMLIQLAYYKYTGTLRPTYESASTRKYFRGRTETCRSVSAEALKFVQDWENTAVSPTEKIKSFRNALKAHGNYIKLASAGFGVDRHLFGLKQMMEVDSNAASSKVVKALFDDPVCGYSQYWYLSTSQLSSENFNGYGWSPVVPEGFGLAYMINKKWLHVNVTCHKENPFGFKAEEMAQCLTEAVTELKEVLSHEKVAAKL
jgi:carnitine O-acetyltransferase